jgi:hypothetical protein
MIFRKELKNNSRTFHMWCELTETGQTFEKFTLWATDNPYKTIVLQNNRSLTQNISIHGSRNQVNQLQGSYNQQSNTQARHVTKKKKSRRDLLGVAAIMINRQIFFRNYNALRVNRHQNFIDI